MILVKDWRKGLSVRVPIETLVLERLRRTPVAIEGHQITRRAEFMEAMLDLIYTYQDVITVHEQMLFNAYKTELQSMAVKLKEEA